MRWMRGLLRDFAERGGTVLLSSHLLHEVDVIADRLVIIGGGRIVAQGSRDELLSHAGTQVQADDGPALGKALGDAGLTAREAEGGGYLVDAEPRAVGAAAQKGGVALVHLAPAGDAGLEQLFFDLTSGENDGNHPNEGGQK
jgi:ABC-2 type transport system ATP-binding protein